MFIVFHKPLFNHKSYLQNHKQQLLRKLLRGRFSYKFPATTKHTSWHLRGTSRFHYFRFPLIQWSSSRNSKLNFFLLRCNFSPSPFCDVIHSAQTDDLLRIRRLPRSIQFLATKQTWYIQSDIDRVAFLWIFIAYKSLCPILRYVFQLMSYLIYGGDKLYSTETRLSD